MGWDEILDLSRQGVEIGSHTVSHPHLTKVSLKEAKNELQRSRGIIEDKLNKPVRTLLYPYGDSNSAIESLAAEAGYTLACTIDRGNLHASSARLRLKRVPMDEFTTIPRLRWRLSPLYHYSCRFLELSRRIRRQL
jgi:peptidoglycan/xylan/chitin deacetylase (PgdA/CDA1 family)